MLIGTFNNIMPFQGLLTLWAVRNDSLFEAAVEHNIVSGVSAILSGRGTPWLPAKVVKRSCRCDSHTSNCKLFLVDKDGHNQ